MTGDGDYGTNTVCGSSESKKAPIEKELVDSKDAPKIVGTITASKAGGVLGLSHGIVPSNTSKVADVDITDVAGSIKATEVGSEGTEKCGKLYVGEKITTDARELAAYVPY